MFDNRKNARAMTQEERDAAMDKFIKRGGKVTKCPTRIADETLWLGGRPKAIEVTTPVEAEDES